MKTLCYVKEASYKRKILLNSTYMKYLDWFTVLNQQAECGFQVMERRENRATVFSGGRVADMQDKEFWRWVVVTVVQQCAHT